MKRRHYSGFLIQRLIFLLAGNLLLLLAIGFLLKEGGSFWDVLRRCGPDVAPVVLAGLGMTGIIFTGAIDLSVASIIVVAGTTFGILVYHHVSPLICYLASFGVAWSLSMLNGVLVRSLRIPAIIITLAGLTFYRGVALILADLCIANFGGNISVPNEVYHTPGKIYAGWILVAVLLVALFWEAFAKTPRCWLALGSSEEACRLLGLRPGAILQSAFCASGIFLGLAALIFVTRVQYIEPARLALGFELQVIGAVVVGGTNIFGGEGGFAGTILGAFFLYFIIQFLTYAGVNPYFQEAVTGAIIISVIGLDCALHRQRKLLEEIS
ncbi:MAG TPA: ABC transporter permease [Candidatus Eisenbacteria bacterium]|nr:ABC transporter permease [Candidatus Eisenbacteria bacterium]